MHAFFGLPHKLIRRERAINSQDILLLLNRKYHNLFLLVELLLACEGREARAFDPLFEESFKLLVANFLANVEEVIMRDCTIVILALSSVE